METARAPAGLVAVSVVETSGFLAGWGQLGAGTMGGGWPGGAASLSFWKTPPLSHAQRWAQERVQRTQGSWLGGVGLGNTDPRPEKMGEDHGVPCLVNSPGAAVSIGSPKAHVAKEALPLRCWTE